MGSGRLFVSALSVALLSGLAYAQASSAEWPGWLGPQRDGKSPDKGLLKAWPQGGPKLLWKIDNIGAGFSTVAITGGSIYTTGDVDGEYTLFALDMNGKAKWQVAVEKAYSGDHKGARSTPVIDGGKVYITSGEGLIGCYAAVDGKKLWTHTMQEFGGQRPTWGYAESVLIYGNMAIVTPGGKNCIVALDKNDGKTIWQSQGFDGPAQYGSCIAVTYQNVPMIVAGTNGGLVAVSPKDGQVLWSNPFCAKNVANCPTPAYADGYIFWANGYGKGGICMKLSISGGKVTASEAWTTRDMVCHHGGYIIDNGLIYGNHNDGWSCLDLKTGQKKWFARGVGKGSIFFADGMLYMFSENGGVAGLAPASPAGLESKGSFTVAGSGPSWAHPVVIGGRLYLRYDTNLYCYDVKTQ